jgi:hypothetical protein
MLDQWHDFFVMVGGGAAALAGLVFVAMTLNLDVIFRDTTHRSRAVGTLTGFAAVFMICALALMGNQSYLAVGIEWLVVSSIAMFVYVSGYIRAIQSGGSSAGLNPGRLVGGTALHLAQMLGSILLIAGVGAGIYVAGAALVVYVGFMISGAWLLMVGIHKDQTNGGKR